MDTGKLLYPALSERERAPHGRMVLWASPLSIPAITETFSSRLTILYEICILFISLRGFDCFVQSLCAFKIGTNYELEHFFEIGTNFENGTNHELEQI
jgi:hypothetical protein